MTKEGSGSFILDGASLITTIVLHEMFLSRWLAPLASALASALISALIFTPFYLYRYRRFYAKRLVVFVVFMALVIYVIERMTT